MTEPRKACLEDFLGFTHIPNTHDNAHRPKFSIAKNQQDFGHKKRIKP